MTKDWRNSIDNREAVAAVAVDLSKALAFDAISHRTVARKIEGLWLLSLCLGHKAQLQLEMTEF